MPSKNLALEFSLFTLLWFGGAFYVASILAMLLVGDCGITKLPDTPQICYGQQMNLLKVTMAVSIVFYFLIVWRKFRDKKNFL